MRVDGLCDTSPGVTEYHFDDRIVDTGRIEQGRQRVPTLMWGVTHRQLLQYPIPAAPESVVSVDRTNLSAPLPCGQKRKDTTANGDLADSGLGLTVPNVNIALADFYVLRPQSQILPDAKTRIYQNQYILFQSTHP